jgi:hypothetical protein
MEWRIGFSSSA